VERVRYRVMSRLARDGRRSPFRLARLRGEGEPVAEDTDLLIESFPRPASSFALAAFNLAHEPARLKVAHHTHAGPCDRAIVSACRSSCSCGILRARWFRA
jgi:hypothetical protein